MIVRQYVMTSDVYSFMDLPVYYELEKQWKYSFDMDPVCILTNINPFMPFYIVILSFQTFVVLNLRTVILFIYTLYYNTIY